MGLRLGIDASNIRAGGGVTHLAELLRAAKPAEHGFDEVIVWSNSGTLAKLDDRPWLHKAHDPLLEGSLHQRVFWQWRRLTNHARAAHCDLLFLPGGSDVSGFSPAVSMSQNLIPFDARTIRQYGVSLLTLKWLLLRSSQGRAFRRAAGVVFLTEFARDAVLQVTGPLRGATAVVPHGINQRFLLAPRPQRAAAEFTAERPYRLLYVSVVEAYKHHPELVAAVAQLRSRGVPVVLDLVGPPGPGSARLREALALHDPEGTGVTCHGAVPYETLDAFYQSADIAVFASSCETFGQILIEAMGAGLPIACSNRSAMPETLGDAGEYFDPEQPAEIAAAIKQLIDSPSLRAEKAAAAFQRAQQFSWERCARETFSFLARVAAQANATGDVDPTAA
jgi:glycosyltransferase involved in cell wall biosynthesis